MLMINAFYMLLFTIQQSAITYSVDRCINLFIMINVCKYIKLSIEFKKKLLIDKISPT